MCHPLAFPVPFQQQDTFVPLLDTFPPKWTLRLARRVPFLHTVPVHSPHCRTPPHVSPRSSPRNLPPTGPPTARPNEDRQQDGASAEPTRNRRQDERRGGARAFISSRKLRLADDCLARLTFCPCLALVAYLPNTQQTLAQLVETHVFRAEFLQPSATARNLVRNASARRRPGGSGARHPPSPIKDTGSCVQ